MIVSVIYNYRTSSEGTVYYDSFILGGEYNLTNGIEIIVDTILIDDKDGSAIVHCRTTDEKRAFTITQKNVSQVIEEYGH
jgi:hypothetical protein